MDENLIKIDLEDIQDLIIQKKFVRINSDKYTDNAFNYVKYLVDREKAILFDADTKRIYTLGSYYGGDELKENLLYFSKILSVDVDNNILDEIDTVKNEDIIGIRGKDALKVNFNKEGNFNVIELEYSIENAIEPTIYKFDPDGEYKLYINSQGQIALQEYIYPKIEIISEPLMPDDELIQTLSFNVKSSLDVSEWESFNIDGISCTIVEYDLLNKTITIAFEPQEEATIIIDYFDGKTSGTYTYIQKWYRTGSYGLYNGINFVERGQYKFIDNDIEELITIDQGKSYYAYVTLPIDINPIFIDTILGNQGAWHKLNKTSQYNIYITDNSGLGKVKWKIINKNI